MIEFKQTGDFKHTEKFLKSLQKNNLETILEKYGKQGVEALRLATPVDSGVTADSWDYEIKMEEKSITLSWTNSNFNDGMPIAVLIQYGHGTRNGGYVEGRDYINPTMAPIFDEISKNILKEVSR